MGVTNSSKTTLDCELIGLMWLLDLNKSFYIPTVSAVVRALMYSDDHNNNNHTNTSSASSRSLPTCSLDTENMPLALDYLEMLSHSPPKTKSGSARQALGPPTLPLLLTLLIVVIVVTFSPSLRL